MKILRATAALLFAVIALLLALPVTFVALMFWAVRRATIAFAHRLEPDHVPWEQLIEFDPHLGWKPRSDMNLYAVTLADPEVFHVLTDHEGWTGRNTIEESDIVVLGDSFAFGYAIDYEESFAAAPKPAVKALGAPGYNLVQELMLLRSIAGRLRGKLVVWLVYYGNDLYDNLAPEVNGYRAPFARCLDGAGWQIAVEHLTDQPWSASRGRQAEDRTHIREMLSKPSSLSERALGALEYLLGEGKAVCAEAGADLTIVTIPRPDFLGSLERKREESTDFSSRRIFPDVEVEAICARLSIPIVLGTAVFTRAHFRPTDDHWNAGGHHTFRKLLEELHERRVARPRPSPLENPDRVAVTDRS